MAQPLLTKLNALQSAWNGLQRTSATASVAVGWHNPPRDYETISWPRGELWRRSWRNLPPLVRLQVGTRVHHFSVSFLPALEVVYLCLLQRLTLKLTHWMMVLP